MQTKKIAEQILLSVDQSTIITLQLDINSVRNLDKLFKNIKGFNRLTSKEIQFHVPISIDLGTTNIEKFKNELSLQKRPLNNVKFTVVDLKKPTTIKSIKPL